MDVGGLGGAGDELDAGLLVVSLHGLGYHTPLVRPELAGYHVGNGGARPLLPQLSLSKRFENKTESSINELLTIKMPRNTNTSTSLVLQIQLLFLINSCTCTMFGVQLSIFKPFLMAFFE